MEIVQFYNRGNPDYWNGYKEFSWKLTVLSLYANEIFVQIVYNFYLNFVKYTQVL